MPININGTTGISGVDGSAGTPSIQGSDTNTGVFFPAADTAAITTGGAERVRVDSSGNVGIGTSSPSAIATYTTLDIRGGSGGGLRYGSSSAHGYLYSDASGSQIGSATNHPLLFFTNGSERARITSGGVLLINNTATVSTGQVEITKNGERCLSLNNSATGASANEILNFIRNGTQVGNINTTGSATAYVTSSDYRLKENVQPMTGALAKVAALKPVTYKWKLDGSDGQGFIAHELQEICPDAVTGEKDAMEADGVTPRYQGVDTSFLVATLTAAIQELNAKVEAQAAEIAILKGAA